MLSIDSRALVSRADLLYDRPVEHPVQGQPIGDSCMGSIVWTIPEAIHSQINRTQYVLPHGGVENVQREVRLRIRDLAPGGGYVLGCAQHSAGCAAGEHLRHDRGGARMTRS